MALTLKPLDGFAREQGHTQALNYTHEHLPETVLKLGVARENRMSQAVFKCVACGCEADADINAAQNILAAGLAVTGRGGTPQALSQSGPAKRQPSEEEVA